MFHVKRGSWYRNLQRHRKLPDPLGCVPCKKSVMVKKSSETLKAPRPLGMCSMQKECHGKEILIDIESSPTLWDVFHAKIEKKLVMLRKNPDNCSKRKESLCYGYQLGSLGLNARLHFYCKNILNYTVLAGTI